MHSINKISDINLTLEELSKKSSFCFKNTETNSEKILKYLKIALNQDNKISVENLSIYRLESLINIITTKKKMINSIKINEDAKERICELEIKIEKYTKKAIPLIKEIVQANQIKQCNLDSDRELLDVV
jgi:hypothetical protein